MTTKNERKRFTTPPFHGSYPNVFAPKKNDLTGKMEFSIAGIWHPKEFSEADKKLWQAINNEIVRVICEHTWPGKVKITKPDPAVFNTANARRIECEARLLKKFPKANMGIRDGAEKEDKPGYGPGTYFASLKTPTVGGVPTPPGVVDLGKNPIHPSEGNADEIYPGAICRATVSIFAYPDPSKKDTGGRGYSLSLNNVQKIKDGERLDNRVKAEDDFDEEVDAAWIDEAGDTGETDDDEIPF